MKRILPFLVLIALTVTACISCNDDKDKTADTDNSAAIKPPAVMDYNVLKTYPHDPSSFTEGLFLLNGFLYEGTGENGKSRLLKAELETGKIIQKVDLDKTYFGEGISMINNKIYQATWQEHKVFVYDMNFKKIGEFEWPYEGWGMTTDGKSLIMDTGGSNIYFINPETFKIERTLGVSDNNGYVDSINELEYVDGYLYANIWQTEYIIKINIQTGLVEAKADMIDLHRKANLTAPSADHFLNGIAYDSAKKSFYITGKNWPTMFEVRFN
ncbi:MAG: glutaminyl-peptide cyclotransferase [Bacteroidota bacterium]